MARRTIKKKRPDGYDTRIYAANIEPDPRLAGLVSYWRVTSHGKYMHRDMFMTPDECMEISFNFRSTGVKRTAMVAGVLQKPIRFKTQNLVDLIGIKFMPGSFYSLFRVPADSLTGTILPLRSVLGRNAARFNKVFERKSLGSRIGLINALLVDFAREREPVKPEIQLVLEKVRERKGKITISEMAEITGWTRQWFSESFGKWVGTTPRAFCMNSKLVNAIRKLNTGAKPAAVAQETGYSDQAHLSRSFKRGTGFTTKTMFRSKRFKKVLPLEP